MANPRGIGKHEMHPLTEEKRHSLDMFYLNRAVKAGTYNFTAEHEIHGTTIPYLEIPLMTQSKEDRENEAHQLVRMLKEIGIDIKDPKGTASVNAGVIHEGLDGQALFVSVGGYDILQKMAEAGLELPAAEILGLEVKKSHVNSAKRGA